MNYNNFVNFQSGIYCYCGNTYDRYGPTTCKKPCSGDASQICGDTWGITVYSGNLNTMLLPFKAFHIQLYYIATCS